ncbi:hypothetical protein [Streptomyces sp. NPDC059063]|uniref:hypothetical protein n=1 Tax=Streptomyces sp. NPDC059063 TaxID=3346712 RepID=UPI0036B528FA
MQPGEDSGLQVQLETYVHQLLLEVEELAVRMVGETRQTAAHVVLRACDLLQAGPRKADTAAYVEDLAGACRALLALREQPGPLGPVRDDELAAAVHTRVCRECTAAISDGEHTGGEPGSSPSGAR